MDTSEMSRIIEQALKEFQQAHLANSHMVFATNVVEVRIRDWSYNDYLSKTVGLANFDSENTIITVNFPYDYFYQETLDLLDQAANVQTSDSLNTKALKRCKLLLNDEYNDWFKTHPYSVFNDEITYTQKDFVYWVNLVIDSLNKNKHWQLELKNSQMRGSMFVCNITDKRVWNEQTKPMRELNIFSSWFQKDNDAAQLWISTIKDQGKDITNFTLEQRIAIILAYYLYQRMKSFLADYGY